ncbi:insulinase family protein [Acinetobacter qingfengensis]|uniref:Protease n=1 Tax=Acinetobacter qingfengensis TaxID=1262585 RepID=A0A1E7RAN3_9GAMM|nr:pitrilysin family protein [Acinetobacter qingfengensis]KAA8734803.1 insulinase family protein [Acinetobacter qingfengensis]OEY96430.1 protease [Acinetobacter qingfengensis]
MLLSVRKIALTLCVLGITANVWAAPVLVKTEQNIYEYKLDNGLKVILAPNPQESKIYMNTIYFTGSLNDPQGKGGLAHLLEHLAFKGTQNVQGETFQRQLDQFTLSNNASTDYYSTRYINTIRPDKNAYHKILYLEAQRMDQLVLQDKFIPTEIEIVRREREMRLDQPLSIMIDQVFKAAYGNQSFGRLPIGDLDELKSIKLPELKTFYQQYYAPNNAAIVITGKFDLQDMLQQIDKNFTPISAKTLPVSVKQPVVDLSIVTQRHFSVEKGSKYGKFNIYMAKNRPDIETALPMLPYLLTIEPSGRLYQNMVKTGVSSNVLSTIWLTPDFNLLFVGAWYTPSQDATKVEQDLIQNVEQGQPYTESDVKRLQNIIKNTRQDVLANSVLLGSILGEYIANQRNWDQYFIDQNASLALNASQINQVIKQVFTSSQRLATTIQPTPDSQKQALTATSSTATLHTSNVIKKEEFKDVKTYQKEIKTDVSLSKQLINTAEKNIQRGKLSNGVKYALYPVDTKDNRVYAKISLKFLDEKALLNQESVVDFLAYLILRGSDKYSYQEIVDKSIALDGSASVTSSGNGLTVTLNARKENFQAYFDFIMDILKHPRFDQQEFDLAKSQSLRSLEQPFTEPNLVSALTIERLMERYQPGDLRYHFEPELAKEQLQKIDNEQVKAFYQQYIAMDHAQVAVTGQFDIEKVRADLEQQLGQWNKYQPYQPVNNQYFIYQAQKHHVLAEQRESGSYRGVLLMPIGDQHPDSAALVVMNRILGNSQISSRLGQGLREKNALVYSFRSNLNRDADTDLSTLTISADYQVDKSQEVSQVIHQVFAEFIKNGVTQQELEAAKADILKQRLVQLNDSRTIHGMLNYQLEHDKTLLDRQKRDQEFAKLTVQDVNRVIRQYLKPEHFVEVMADQYGKQQK